MDLSNFLNAGSLITLNSGDILIGWGKKVLKSSHGNHFSFYLSDFFFKNEKPWFEHEYQITIKLIDFLTLLQNIPVNGLKEISWNSPNKFFFSSSYENLKTEYLSKDILKKGVPFTFQTSQESLCMHQLIASLKSLLEHGNSTRLFLYGSWDQEHGILGGTPEILFKRNASNPLKIETLACAGTASSKCNSNELLSDDKQKNEHQIVIDGIIDVLKSFGKIEVKKTSVSHYSNIKHLLTEIMLTSHEIMPFDELVHLLHPTPALGTYPKMEGKKWLEEMQCKVDRKYFGGPVGYFNGSNHESACYVAIRNMQWNKSTIQLTAGCGVIKESIKENEWKEILLKLRAIRKMLAL